MRGGEEEEEQEEKLVLGFDQLSPFFVKADNLFHCQLFLWVCGWKGSACIVCSFSKIQMSLFAYRGERYLGFRASFTLRKIHIYYTQCLATNCYKFHYVDFLPL